MTWLMLHVNKKLSDDFPSLSSHPDSESHKDLLSCVSSVLSLFPSQNDQSCQLSSKLFGLGARLLIQAHRRGLKSVLPSNISEHQQTEGLQNPLQPCTVLFLCHRNGFYSESAHSGPGPSSV